MSAFLEDLTPFYGTGEKNENGLTLPEFLEAYDPNHYQNPSVTADILVFQYEEAFTLDNGGLQLLMIRRKNHPGIGCWALPGGFVNLKETTDDAAKRELREETGLDGIAVEQLYCWGDWQRDPRTRIVTISYLALVQEKYLVQAGDDAADAVWMTVICQKEKEGTAENGRIFKNYRVLLENKEKNLKFSLLVEVTENAKGLLKEPHYRVLEGASVAFDHPCFIVQALLYLQTLIK